MPDTPPGDLDAEKAILADAYHWRILHALPIVVRDDLSDEEKFEMLLAEGLWPMPDDGTRDFALDVADAEGWRELMQFLGLSNGPDASTLGQVR